MDWKPSYDPVLGYSQRSTTHRLYTPRLYWKGVGVDGTNFWLRYDLKRIRQRAKFLVKDAGLNAIYALDLHCMEKLAPLVGGDRAVFAKLRRRVLKSLVERMYDEQTAAFYDARDSACAGPPRCAAGWWALWFACSISAYRPWKAICWRRSYYQRAVHLPPALTISAQVMLGMLLGVLGIVFATPITPPRWFWSGNFCWRTKAERGRSKVRNNNNPTTLPFVGA
jgi:hypothetical protein